MQPTKVGRLIFSDEEWVRFRYRDFAEGTYEGKTLEEEVRGLMEHAEKAWREAELREKELEEMTGEEDPAEEIWHAGFAAGIESVLHDILNLSHGIWLPGRGYGESVERPIEIQIDTLGFDPIKIEFEEFNDLPEIVQKAISLRRDHGLSGSELAIALDCPSVPTLLAEAGYSLSEIGPYWAAELAKLMRQPSSKAMLCDLRRRARRLREDGWDEERIIHRLQVDVPDKFREAVRIAVTRPHVPGEWTAA